MPETSSLTLFLAASLVLLVIPGPAVLFIVARSIDHGALAGIVSALGLAVGSVLLVVAAAFGVTALIAASPAAFDAIRYLGAAYLVYLAVRAWRTREPADAAPAAPDASLGRVFAEALVVNLLNPKTALFLFAFLPQFVSPARDPRGQILVLGLLFTGMGVVTDSLYALGAGGVAARLRGSPRFPAIRRIAVSLVYLGLALAAALVHPTKQ